MHLRSPRTRPGILVALAPLLAVGCSFGDWADPAPRPFELHTIELDVEDGTRVMVGLDDDGVPLSTSALFTEGDVAAFRIEHEGDWLTVTAALDTGDVALRHDRDGWTYAWSSTTGEPLAADVDDRWRELTFAWRSALAPRDRLRDGIGWAVNVAGEQRPIDAPADDWRRICSTVVDWQCAAAPATAALGCRVAGLAYCEANTP
jgi:hypothetical protein